MTVPDTTDHLRGPWRALLVHSRHREVIDSLDHLRPDDEVDISIRRGSALPHEDDESYLPGSYASGDIIELWDNLYVEDGDPSTDAAARWAQAQAMAAGLNAACIVVQSEGSPLAEIARVAKLPPGTE